MHLEEAIPAVTDFIDDALMVGVSEVSILHGKGAGVLKEEIRKFLKITPGVVSFADEHVERGGTGMHCSRLLRNLDFVHIYCCASAIANKLALLSASAYI